MRQPSMHAVGMYAPEMLLKEKSISDKSNTDVDMHVQLSRLPYKLFLLTDMVLWVHSVSLHMGRQAQQGGRQSVLEKRQSHAHAQANVTNSTVKAEFLES